MSIFAEISSYLVGNFQQPLSVLGIFNMHLIESSSISTKLWRNASYISNAPDFTVPAAASEVAGSVPSSGFYGFGDWIIFRYLFYIIPRVNLFYFSWNH